MISLKNKRDNDIDFFWKQYLFDVQKQFNNTFWERHTKNFLYIESKKFRLNQKKKRKIKNFQINNNFTSTPLKRINQIELPFFQKIKMRIIVRGCQTYGRNAYSLEVERIDQISAVKRKISNKTGIVSCIMI